MTTRKSGPGGGARALALLFSLGALAFVSLSATTARAAGPSRDECIAAADEGQKLRDDGKLNAARDKFVVCATKTCPNIIAKSCASWRDDADRDMPTVTFRVLDEGGKEVLDAKIAIDETKDAQPITAKAAPLDPGEHVAHARRDGGRTADEKFLLRPGEKNRMIELHFAPLPPPPSQPKPGLPPPSAVTNDGFRVPLLGWVGLGVFVAGGATTTVFAVMAKSDESDLRSRGCAPNCPSSDKDSINTKLLVANVGMGIGIVGLGVTVVTTVLANTGHNKSTSGVTSSVPGPAVGAVRVDASPQVGRDGVGVILSGSF